MTCQLNLLADLGLEEKIQCILLHVAIINEGNAFAFASTPSYPSSFLLSLNDRTTESIYSGALRVFYVLLGVI